MHRVLLGLGSNLGDRLGHLTSAVEALPAAGVAVTAVSSVYETDPVGGPVQGDFLNIVVEGRTHLDPHGVLAVCRALENAAERVREERWGPRTLDVDLLLHADHVVDTDDLAVPHPRMWQRRFVVAPLAEVAPDLVPDGALDAAEGEVRVAGPWPGSPVGGGG